MPMDKCESRVPKGRFRFFPESAIYRLFQEELENGQIAQNEIGDLLKLKDTYGTY